MFKVQLRMKETFCTQGDFLFQTEEVDIIGIVQKCADTSKHRNMLQSIMICEQKFLGYVELVEVDTVKCQY